MKAAGKLASRLAHRRGQEGDPRKVVRRGEGEGDHPACTEPKAEEGRGNPFAPSSGRPCVGEPAVPMTRDTRPSRVAPQRAGAFGLSESPGQARSRAFASIPAPSRGSLDHLCRSKLSSLPPLSGRRALQSGELDAPIKERREVSRPVGRFDRSTKAPHRSGPYYGRKEPIAASVVEIHASAMAPCQPDAAWLTA